MSMLKTRNVLSVILEMVIGAAFLAFLCVLAVIMTVSSKEYFESHIVTDEIVAQCQTQMDEKYTMLERESGIPLRVFKMVEKDESIRTALQQSVQYMSTAENTELYTPDRIEHYYALCTEYLDGNEIEYNETSVRNTAIKAAQLYSETVGLHHAEDINEKIAYMNSQAAAYAVVSFAIAALSFSALMLMYKRKDKGYVQAFGGLGIGSLGTLLGALLVLLTKPYAKLGILPQVYNAAVVAMAHQCFALMALLGGAGLIASAVAIAVVYLKQQNRED